MSYLVPLSIAIFLAFANTLQNVNIQSSLMDSLDLSSFISLFSKIFHSDQQLPTQTNLQPVDSQFTNEHQEDNQQNMSQAKQPEIPNYNVVVCVLGAAMIVSLKIYQRIRGIIQEDNVLEDINEINEPEEENIEEELQEQSKFPVNIYFLEDKKKKLINIPKNAIIIYV